MSFCSQASEYWPLYRHFMRTREQYALALYERSRITWLDLRRNRRCKPGDFRATLVEFLSNFRRQLVASHWHRGDTQPEVREDQWRHRRQECDAAALEATSWYIWCSPPSTHHPSTPWMSLTNRSVTRRNWYHFQTYCLVLKSWCHVTF